MGKSFKCDQEGCQQTFKKERNLTIHIRDVHSIQPRRVKGYKTGRKNKDTIRHHLNGIQLVKLEKNNCKKCHRKFGNRQRLKEHLRLDHSNQTFYCSIGRCEKSYRSKRALKYHIKMHRLYKSEKKSSKCDQKYDVQVYMGHSHIESTTLAKLILSTLFIVFALCFLISIKGLGSECPVNAISVEQELHRLSESNNEFGMHLLNVLERNESQRESNIVVSPYSISAVLTMSMIGAGGNTYTQLFNTLGYSQSQFLPTIMDTHHKLRLELNRKVADTSISSANAIVKQKSLPILRHYQTALETYFNSSVFPADAQLLNEWVTGKTNGKIDKIFDDDTSMDDAEMILLNAIYFKGTWMYKFHLGTIDYEFQVRKDYYKTVEMMRVWRVYEYAEFDDGQLVKLPYRDHHFSMLVFLPHNHTHTPLSSMFTSHSLSTRMAQLKREDVHLYLPKFRVKANYQLSDTLIQLGIVDAFYPFLADFSNISTKRLYTSKVVHKAVINVNEHGTEAVAMTFNSTIPLNAISAHKLFKVVRPFVFFIRDDRTGVILFVGVIHDPQV